MQRPPRGLPSAPLGNAAHRPDSPQRLHARPAAPHSSSNTPSSQRPSTQHPAQVSALHDEAPPPPVAAPPPVASPPPVPDVPPPAENDDGCTHWPSWQVKPESEQFMHELPSEPHEPGSMPLTHWPDEVQQPEHEPGPQPPACTLVSHAITTAAITARPTARITRRLHAAHRAPLEASWSLHGKVIAAFARQAQCPPVCWRRRPTMTSTAVLSLLLASGTPTALVFSSDGTCGDEAGIRAAITVRLGRDPFRDDTVGPRFVASIARAAQGWTSTLSVDDGAPRRRTSTDCRELTQSLALNIALVLEPAVTVKPPPPTPPPPEPPPSGPVWSLGAALFGSGGLSPHLTAGLALIGALRSSQFVLDVEARVDVPAATASGGVTFRSFPVLLSVAPGFAAGPVRVTAPVSGGALFVTGSSSGVGALLLAGLQVSGAFPLGSGWLLEPFARAQASIFRVTVLGGQTPVWTAWPIAAVAGVAVRHEFL